MRQALSPSSRPAALVDARFARGLIKAQACLLVSPLFVWCFKGECAAVSLLLGVLIALIGNIYATWRSYYANAHMRRDAKQVVSAMMKAYFGKLAITMLGLLIVFKYIRPLEAGMLLLGLAMVQLMAWVYPQWLYRQS